jgi:hypothetical protein
MAPAGAGLLTQGAGAPASWRAGPRFPYTCAFASPNLGKPRLREPALPTRGHPTIAAPTLEAWRPSLPFTSHSDNSQRQQHQQSQHVEDPLPASQSQRIHVRISIPSMEPLRRTVPSPEGRKNVIPPKNYDEKWHGAPSALTRASQPVAYGDETYSRHCRRRARNP